jgi:multiple sugar transport system substrate-binding protein
MKKCFCLIVGAAVLAGSLFAGGKQAASSGGPVTIKVWSDNASEKALRDAQIAKFNDGRGKELGIKIEYTIYGTNFADAIKTALQAGEAPHLYRSDGKTQGDFIRAGWSIPITDLPGGQALVDQYKGALVPNMHTWDGKAYTLPYNVTTYKFLVNKDIFAQAGITAMPKTWADVRAMAKQATDAGKGQYYGFILGLASPWSVTSYFLFPNGVNSGIGVFDNTTLQYNFSSQLPMAEAVMGMIADGSVHPDFITLDADRMRAEFAAGHVAMIPGASFDVGVYRDQFPAKFNWDVIEVPAAGSGTRYREVVQATQLLAVSTTAKKNLQETMEVLKFFYDDQNAAEMYEQGFYIPYRSEALNLVKTQPDAKGWAEFADVPQKMMLLPSPDTEISLEGLVYREVIIRMFSGGYRDQTPAQVLKSLDDRYNEAVGKLKQSDPALLESFRAPADYTNKL